MSLKHKQKSDPAVTVNETTLFGASRKKINKTAGAEEEEEEKIYVHLFCVLFIFFVFSVTLTVPWRHYVFLVARYASIYPPYIVVEQHLTWHLPVALLTQDKNIYIKKKGGWGGRNNKENARKKTEKMGFNKTKSNKERKKKACYCIYRGMYETTRVKYINVLVNIYMSVCGLDSTGWIDPSESLPGVQQPLSLFLCFSLALYHPSTPPKNTHTCESNWRFVEGGEDEGGGPVVRSFYPLSYPFHPGWSRKLRFKNFISTLSEFILTLDNTKNLGLGQITLDALDHFFHLLPFTFFSFFYLTTYLLLFFTAENLFFRFIPLIFYKNLPYAFIYFYFIFLMIN